MSTPEEALQSIQPLEEVERVEIEYAMKVYHTHRLTMDEVANRLGICKKTLQNKRKKYGFK